MLDFEFIRDNWLYIATGTGVTLGIAIISFLLAIPIAVIVTKGRCSPLLPIKALSTFYVWLVDGIPLLLQIFFIFLALPQLGITLPGFWAGVFVLTVNYGSRMSEILYARVAATGKSQAGTWLSLSASFAKEFTNMIKDSTIISVTGFIHDVMWRASRVGRAEFKNLEAFLIAASIYLVLITVISLGVKAFQAMLATAKSGSEGST